MLKDLRRENADLREKLAAAEKRALSLRSALDAASKFLSVMGYGEWGDKANWRLEDK